MTEQLPEQELEPSGLFDPDLRRLAVAEFGSDGAWLLLSIVFYGWRTHYDLACALLSGGHPQLGGDPRPLPIGPEFQIARDLQIQAAVFAAAEQFATLVRAARRHVRGDETFFDAYVGAPMKLEALLGEVADITRAEVVDMLGDPDSFRPVGGAGTALLDPATVETTDVGGLHVPREVIDGEALRNLVRDASAVIDLVVGNARELGPLVASPATLAGVEVGARPLREVDNAFRHGLRMLLHACVPEVRRFRVGSQLEEATDYSVDLYMPHRRGPETIRFGTVSCTVERTMEHMEALRQLSTRTGQVARGLLGRRVMGDARWLVVASRLLLPDPPRVTP